MYVQIYLQIFHAVTGHYWLTVQISSRLQTINTQNITYDDL